jgi:peptidoglycan/xylan/chitin deacetylase (PgdA/CDA1 family)
VEKKSEQYRQIKSNKERLEGITGAPVRGFAYPNGSPGVDFDDVSVSAVRELGFDYAVTTLAGVSRTETDPFYLRRFKPWDRHIGKFYLRLLYNSLRG